MVATTKPDFWCESDSAVGTISVSADEFGRIGCTKVIAERRRFISRDEREDMDEFGAPTGVFREVGVLRITEAEAIAEDPSVASVIAAAAEARAKLTEELAKAAVAYETNRAWWLEPNTDSPMFGDCYGVYQGLGLYRWYRRVGDRVQVLKRGEWERAVKDARKNDYLRQDEKTTPPGSVRDAARIV